MNRFQSLSSNSLFRVSCHLSDLGSARPKAAVVNTIEATKDSIIIIAENNPNVLNNPIEEVAMIEKPAISEMAEPTNARAQAPPTPCNA